MRSLAMPLQTTPARAGSTWLARYAVNAGDSCDFAIVVADDSQRHGPGSHLITLLVNSASARGLKCIGGDVLAINGPMAAFAKTHGLSLKRSHDEPTSLLAERTLVANEYELMTNGNVA